VVLSIRAMRSAPYVVSMVLRLGMAEDKGGHACHRPRGGKNKPKAEKNDCRSDELGRYYVCIDQLS
jgi:hypothetical protein